MHHLRVARLGHESALGYYTVRNFAGHFFSIETM
jgi:hypothetical protein